LCPDEYFVGLSHLTGLSKSAITKHIMEIENTVIMQTTRERKFDLVSIRATPKKEKNPRSSRNIHLQNTKIGFLMAASL